MEVIANSCFGAFISSFCLLESLFIVIAFVLWIFDKDNDIEPYVQALAMLTYLNIILSFAQLILTYLMGGN